MPLESKTILAIDPSSSCSGYALLRADGSLIECGLLKPEHADDPANVRIEAMSHDMREIIGEHAPAVVVIEDTSGKVGRRHKGGGAGLAVYGKSVGYMLAEAKACSGVTVEAILENEWTAGTPKRRRLMRLANQAGYDPTQDPGGDAGDAILLGRWWLARNRLAA